MGPEHLEKPVAAHPQKTAVADFGTLLRATVKEAFAHVETSKERETAKTCSRSPDLEQAKSAVLDTLTSKSDSAHTIDHDITEFVEWYCSQPRFRCRPDSRRSSPVDGRVGA